MTIPMGAHYLAFDHEVIREMLLDPNTVTGLSDAGARPGRLVKPTPSAS